MISLNKLLQWLVITLLFPLIFLNGWLGLKFFQYFQPVTTTIILASLLAFILNYPVTLIQQRGLKRGYAIGLVFGSTLIIAIALGITIFPIVFEQFQEMAKILPHWIDSSEQKLLNFNNWASNQGLKVNFSHIVTQLTNRFPDELQYFGNQIVDFTIEAFDSISEALVTIVFTFYLLVDGKRIWNELFKKLPVNIGSKLQQSFQQNFQNYLIGQIALASLMGVSLTLLFLILRVPFGLILGLGIGIASLIPFGDIASLAVVSLIIASHDVWLAVKVISISIIIDQLIDQAIAPRLLGSFTGIRPIWVLTSLLVGAYVGGLLGLLIAVPIAGIIKDALEAWVSPSSENLEGKEIETKELSELLTEDLASQ
ncbi:AI-2E family transporter [Brunnivagina elsteri]|uniref:AI-2E family transporter n=1 Tax=Brunnivagina elsteri CCALA 953 TaxID=987040 RepID=A0A2A2TFK8_9CYAN|nr:AI-2E family transporter [Calothrix elsteri CCALA 953]